VDYGDKDTDMPSLREILAVIEREADAVQPGDRKALSSVRARGTGPGALEAIDDDAND
jgi:hypothetical protein